LSPYLQVQDGIKKKDLPKDPGPFFSSLTWQNRQTPLPSIKLFYLMRLMVSSQTLHFRGSPSFFSLFFLLHCQRNGLSSALRKSSREMLGQHPVVFLNRRVSLQVPLQRWVTVSVCPVHSPHDGGSQRTGRPGCLKLQHPFP
jgi:hypothetical protein